MFRFHRPPLDMFLRTTMVDLALCVLLRLIPKRQAGKLSPNDLIVIVLLGGVATTALEMAPMSVSDVLVVISTILWWSFALDWLAYRFPKVQWLVQESPTRLIRNGKILTANMRREMVTDDELWAQLRTQGIYDIGDIKQACFEADGTVSVIKTDAEQSPTRPTARRPAKKRSRSKKKR